MEPSKLRELIAQPESEILEFKTNLPGIDRTARLISSMANTEGGTLVVGVREGGEVTGVNNPAQAQRVLAQAAQRVSPEVPIQSEIVALEGKPVLIATVQKGDRLPHLVDGQAFQRTGDRAVPITSSILYDDIRERAVDRDAILNELKRLTEVIETLNRQLIASGGWRSRLIDWVIGGIVGALISILLTLLLGTE
jgi:predicted HTH transcriptional regulator